MVGTQSLPRPKHSMEQGGLNGIGVCVCVRRRHVLLWRGLRRWRRGCMSHLTQVHHTSPHPLRHTGRDTIAALRQPWSTFVLV